MNPKKLDALVRSVDMRSIFGSGFIRCPFHDDTKPSMYVYKDGLFCFTCRKQASGLQVLLKQGKTFADAVVLLKQHKGDEVQEYAPAPVVLKPTTMAEVSAWERELWSAPQEVRDWLYQRGLQDELLHDLHIGWVDGRRYSIPHLVNGIVENIKFRVHPAYLMDEEAKYQGLPGHMATQPYPHDYVITHHARSQRVFVTEGEFDAAILLQAGFAAVSLPGGVDWHLTKWFRFLSHFGEVVLMYDMDRAGRQMTQRALESGGWSQGELLRAHLEDGPARLRWDPSWGKDITDARTILIPRLQEVYVGQVVQL